MAEEKTKEETKEETGEEEKDEKVEVPKNLEKIVGEIEKMPVLELAELVKVLEKKFGVSAAAPVAAAAPSVAAAGTAGGGAEEKSSFNIVLSKIGDKKIEVIKLVRDITQKGLKESKELVDGAEKEPQTVRENVKKEEAEEIKKKFEAAGAAVELK